MCNTGRALSSRVSTLLMRCVRELTKEMIETGNWWCVEMLQKRIGILFLSRSLVSQDWKRRQRKIWSRSYGIPIWKCWHRRWLIYLFKKIYVYKDKRVEIQWNFRENEDRGCEENNGGCFGHFNLTIIYLQFWMDLALIYRTPNEVMRVPAICRSEKQPHVRCLTHL